MKQPKQTDQDRLKNKQSIRKRRCWHVSHQQSFTKIGQICVFHWLSFIFISIFTRFGKFFPFHLFVAIHRKNIARMMLKFGTICYFSNLLDKIVSKTVGHAHNWLQQKLIVRKKKMPEQCIQIDQETENLVHRIQCRAHGSRTVPKEYPNKSYLFGEQWICVFLLTEKFVSTRMIFIISVW